VVVQSFGCWASLHTFLTVSSKRFRSMSFVAGVARPPRTREEASNGGCGESPTRCELLGLGIFTPSGSSARCSGTTAIGPTQRWPSRCGSVCPYLASYLTLGLLEGSMSSCVGWWAHAADASSPLRLGCIVVRRTVVWSC
jgi:hypothetical protein